MFGIISYRGYSIQISSESLKRVVRGQKLYFVPGLPDIFSGLIIQGRYVVPVLSRESLSAYIEEVFNHCDTYIKNTMATPCLHKKSPGMYALLTWGGYDFALPLDEVLSIFDDCQKEKSDSQDGIFIPLECADLLNYILLQRGGSNEV